MPFFVFFFIIRRECNTEYGTLDCWKRTTNGFSYGLSTAMIDYCQLILQLHQNNNESLYNISQNILIKEIDKYNIDKKIRQLTNNDIKQVSISLLNKVKYNYDFIFSSSFINFSVFIRHHLHLQFNHHVHHVQ
jgi:hypothetical protein